MKDLKLANKMIDNLDWFKEQPDWQETVDEFKPMIEQIMEEDGCNALKAAVPVLKRFQKDWGDPYAAQMLVAICTDMMIKSKTMFKK